MFIKIGNRVLNLDRVCSVDLDYSEQEPCVRIEFSEVSSWCFYEDECEALRSFFRMHPGPDRLSIVDVMTRASLLAGKDSRAMSEGTTN